MDNDFRDFIDELGKFQNETNYNQEDIKTNTINITQDINELDKVSKC